MGKLHNFVVYVQASPQRLQKLLSLTRDRRIPRDNKTRWGSWEKMLRVAIKDPVFSGIKDYFESYAGDDIALDELSDSDWEVLHKVWDFLDDLNATLTALEGNTATLEKVLPSMDYILEQFEKLKEVYKDDPIMAPMVNSGWAKMEKYYTLTEESPAYVAALVLRPSRKWSYLEKTWKVQWTTKAKQLMKVLWEKEYKPANPTVAITASKGPPKKLNRFQQWEKKNDIATTYDDEYERYIHSDVIPVLNSLDWWLEPTQQLSYPNLSKMAIDFLTIPAMSAEPERVFSGAKLTMTDRRNRLSAEIIEAFECLKSWYKIKEFIPPTPWDEAILAQLVQDFPEDEDSDEGDCEGNGELDGEGEEEDNCGEY